MEVKTLSSFVERIDTDEDTMEDFRESDSESIWELILAAEPGADGDNVFFLQFIGDKTFLAELELAAFLS